MSMLSKEELEINDRKILLKRFFKAKEAQKKTLDETVLDKKSQPEPIAPEGATNQ